MMKTMMKSFTIIFLTHQVWDDELARVAQKWADQCADVDYLVCCIINIIIVVLISLKMTE